MTSPFFIIGSPRSGTTLLRLMLTTHDAIVVPPECGFMLWLEPEFGRWTAAELADPHNRDRLAARIVAARKFETWGLSHGQVLDAIADAASGGYAGACEAVYRLWGARQGKSAAIWGDKNNHYLSHVDALKALYPSARFLHIVRDGRDVACSYREVMALRTASPYRPELPVEIGQIAVRWSGDVRVIRAQLGRLALGDALEIRYEDLVLDPEGGLERICRWFGVSFDPGMLRFHEANRQRGLEPAATIDWKARTLDPVNTATVGRHLSVLSDEERREFESTAGAELAAYGYVIDKAAG